MEKKTATTNYIFHLLLSHHPFLSPSHHRQHVPQTRSSSTSRRRRSRLSSWRRLRTSARSGWRTCCGAPSSPARPPHTPHPSGSPTPQHTSARSARLSSPWWTEGCAGRGRWAVWRLIRFVVYCVVLYCVVLWLIRFVVVLFIVIVLFLFSIGSSNKILLILFAWNIFCILCFFLFWYSIIVEIVDLLPVMLVLKIE